MGRMPLKPLEWADALLGYAATKNVRCKYITALAHTRIFIDTENKANCQILARTLLEALCLKGHGDELARLGLGKSMHNPFFDTPIPGGDDPLGLL